MQHLLNAPESMAQITATIMGSTRDATAAGNKETQNTIQALIDNSLYNCMGGHHKGRGVASRLPRLLCPCGHRPDGGGRTGPRNGAGARPAGSQKKAFSIEGRCWMGFGEGRLVLQADDDAQGDDATAVRPTQGLAASFDGKILSALPEEVRCSCYARLY